MKAPVMRPPRNNDRGSGGWYGENLLRIPDLTEQWLVHGQLKQRAMRFCWDAAVAVNVLYAACKSSLRHERWASGTTLRERNWTDGRRPHFQPLEFFWKLFLQWQKWFWFLTSLWLCFISPTDHILDGTLQILLPYSLYFGILKMVILRSKIEAWLWPEGS